MMTMSYERWTEAGGLHDPVVVSVEHQPIRGVWLVRAFRRGTKTARWFHEFTNHADAVAEARRYYAAETSLRADEDLIPFGRPMSPALFAELRDGLGMTQQELAGQLDVARSTVNRWEQGHVAIPRTVELAMETIARNRTPI